MYQEEKPAYIFAQAVAALCELEGMKAANKEREANGLALAYDEKAFIELQNQYCISHNAVIGFLNG